MGGFQANTELPFGNQYTILTQQATFCYAKNLNSVEIFASVICKGAIKSDYLRCHDSDRQ